MRSPYPLVVALALTSLILGGCSDGSPPSLAPSGSTSATASESIVALSTRERAAQLAASAPATFDATYRLDSKGNRPNANVRMRAKKDRFRLDVERHDSTAVLITNGRGVVSCQVEQRGKKKPPDRTCFLVAQHPNGIPPLFDPRVQRLFLQTTAQIARLHGDVRVSRAADWKAPGRLGNAECFNVRGPDVQNGKYCYLADPGPYIGLLARAAFDSGALNLRSVRTLVRPDSFKPPTSPTPLP